MPDAKNQLIKVEGLTKHFSVGRQGLSLKPRSTVKAVDGLDFHINRAESLGLAGESGCGKTTTAKLLLALFPPTDGRILFEGADLATMNTAALKAFRHKAQMVFQDPYESLNPRFTVLQTLVEQLAIHKEGNRVTRRERAVHTLHEVGLEPPNIFLDRYPHELSGGQRQRVAIARALILNPRLLVSDEPVSMLDVSIRAGILRLLEKLINEKEIAGLCVSHDLSLLRYLCRRTAIMYLGRMIELAPTEELINHPLHPYTEALLEAVPLPDPDIHYRIEKITGEIPSADNIPEGCRFWPRCPQVFKRCRQEQPKAVEAAPHHWVECHLYQHP